MAVNPMESVKVNVIICGVGPGVNAFVGGVVKTPIRLLPSASNASAGGNTTCCDPGMLVKTVKTPVWQVVGMGSGLGMSVTNGSTIEDRQTGRTLIHVFQDTISVGHVENVSLYNNSATCVKQT